MNSVSDHEAPHKSPSSEKRRKFNVGSDTVAVDSAACRRDIVCSDHANESSNSDIVSFTDMCETSMPNATAEEISELSESDGYCTSGCDTVAENDDSSTVEDFDLDTETESFCDHFSAADDDSESKKASQLGDELVDWAGRHNVSQVAVSGLLKILSKYHSSLPKDARTLLKTTSLQPVLPMKDILNNPGEYVYFGIESQLHRHLSNTVSEHSLDQLQLLFNVDGLPLFRSSSKQFWPILCAACIDDVITKPFVIAVLLWQ